MLKFNDLIDFMSSRKMLFLYLLSINISISICVAQENKEITERLKTKYGDASCVESGWYLISNKPPFGACDLLGNEIIPCKYDLVFKVNEYFYVSLNEKMGIFDLDGNEVFPLKYNKVVQIKEYFSIKLNGKKGICDLKGNEIMSCEYDEVIPLDDYYSIQSNGRRGLCDLEGKEIIPCNYEFAYKRDDKYFVELGGEIYEYQLSTQQHTPRIDNSSRATTETPHRKGERFLQVLNVVNDVLLELNSNQPTSPSYNNSSTTTKSNSSSRPNSSSNTTNSQTPKQTPCHLCESNLGKVWAYTNKGNGKCYNCNSRGQINACVNNPFGGVKCSDPNCIAKNHRCNECGGTNICQKCKGTGYLQ